MTTLARLVELGRVLCDPDILITYGHKSASITNHGYVMVVFGHTAGKVNKSYLHRLVMQPAVGMVVDHINRVKVDCRKANLRVITVAQNNLNVAPKLGKYKGVYKSGNNWHAKLSSNGATYSIGSYKSEKQAALAYDAEVYRVHGELAYLNFPEELNHGKIN